jgi:hypothetical protein
MKISAVRYLALTALVFFFSCSKKDKTGLLIPKDAAIVIHINGSSLHSKLSWEDIRKTNWFAAMDSAMRNKDSLARQILQDPESMGIDLNNDLVYFMRMQGGSLYGVFEGRMKDNAAFASFNKKIPGAAAATKDGNINLQEIHAGVVAAWDDKRFAYIHDGGFKEGGQAIPHHFGADSLKLLVKQTLSLSETNTLGTDSRFAALIGEPGDIHFWTNNSVYFQAMPGDMGAYMSMFKLDVLTDQSFSASSLNFEDGKISFHSKQYYGRTLSDLFNKYKAVKLDAALVNRAPADALAVFSLNYQPQELKEFLTLTNLDAAVAIFLSKSNLTIDDIILANKGNMLVAVTGISPRGTDTSSHRPEPKFFVANSVNDKNALNKLVGIAETEGLLKKNPSSGFTYSTQGDWFLAGDDAAAMQGFLSGTSHNNPYADKISGHPVGGYIDFQKMFNMHSEIQLDSIAKKLSDMSKNMWQDVIFSGGDFNDGAIEFKTEVNLVNKKENSLKQLNSYIDSFTKYSGRNMFKRKDRMEIDSIQ